jgi:hypothetical protein
MFISVDKRNGGVMEITAYRVSGEKYPKQIRVYIGKIGLDGEFKPNRLFIDRTKVEELDAEIKKIQESLVRFHKRVGGIQKT